MRLTRGKPGLFVLAVPRGEADVAAIVRDHGWTLSTSATTPNEAVLFTDNKYAAMAFAPYADPELQHLWSPELAAVEQSWSKHGTSNIRVPSGQTLWPFQISGVAYCLLRERSLIGDQPGLGKTAQAICIANEIDARRVLVVCPANIRHQWRDAIRDWTTHPGRPVIYPILRATDGVHPSASFTIISYDLVRSAPIFAGLMRQEYDLLILDEAHFLKSSDAKRTKAVLGDHGLISRARKTVALTGTPLPNRPRECYTLARGFSWASIDFMREADFRDRFNPVFKGETADGKVFIRESVHRLPELQNRLRANFMVRRLKRDVLTQLPPVRYNLHHVDETGAIKKALEAERMLDIDPEAMTGVDMVTRGHISVVRHQMGVAKAPQVADYVDTLLDGGEDKIVLFGWHIEVLDILEQRLGRHGVLRIDGSVPPHRRHERVAQFQADPDKHIMLGNIQAMGVGTDGLQNAASHVVFAEVSWVPGDNEQGVSRLERMGQTTPVIAEFLVAPGSFDEKILGSALRKLRNIRSALDVG